MLGFEQFADTRNAVQEGAKLDAKVGLKVGVKLGTKEGVKA